MAAPPTLLLAAIFSLVTGALYVYVGRVVSRRKVEGDARLASNAFATWWFALGGVTGAGGLMNVAAYLGFTDLALWTTYTYVVFLILCAALWGLLYYLVYLFTGSRKLVVPITAFYAVYFAYLVYLITTLQPNGVKVGEWSTTLSYAKTASRPVTLAVLIALVAPHVVGAIAYARLYFKVDNATQKYRIGLVSGTIIAWFGSSLVVSVLQIGGPWWQVASRLIGVAAAVAIYLAFRPPAWVRQRYGIHAVDETETY